MQNGIKIRMVKKNFKMLWILHTNQNAYDTDTLKLTWYLILHSNFIAPSKYPDGNASRFKYIEMN